MYQVTLTRRLMLRPGHPARLKTRPVQMIDVHLPTTDGREIQLPLYPSQPNSTLMTTEAPPATTAASRITTADLNHSPL